MSNRILKDWIAFCEGRADFPHAHFYTLFMEQKDPEYFRKAFQFFPCASDLFKRMGKVLGFGAPENLAIKVTSSDDALKFASLDLEERVKIAKRYHEPDLVSELSSLTVRYCEDFEIVDQAKHADLHGWMLEVIGDFFRGNLIEDNKKVYELLDAFYGLTTSFELKWFLGTPLTRGDFNLDHYAELWKVGVDYAVKDGELLVGSRMPLS